MLVDMIEELGHPLVVETGNLEEALPPRGMPCLMSPF
jgi:hypothetical protein